MKRRFTIYWFLGSMFAAAPLFGGCSMQPTWFCDANGCYGPDYQWVCTPDYNVYLASEPDWCVYQSGDRVMVHYSTVNGVLTADQWYATHYYDDQTWRTFCGRQGWTENNYVTTGGTVCGLATFGFDC